MRRLLTGTLAALALSGATAEAAVPLPDPMPTIVYAPCPGYPEASGCLDFVTQQGKPTVFLNDRTRATRFHELGHVYDYQHMTDPLRRRFARIKGYRWRDWEAGTEWGPAPLAESFAVAYQVCVMHPRLPGWRHGHVLSYAPGFYEYEVGEREHRKVCALIRSARLHRAPVAIGFGPFS